MFSDGPDSSGPETTKLSRQVGIVKFLSLVGVAGLEPATFRTPCERASHLRHTPPVFHWCLQNVFVGGRNPELPV